MEELTDEEVPSTSREEADPAAEEVGGGLALQLLDTSTGFYSRSIAAIFVIAAKMARFRRDYEKLGKTAKEASRSGWAKPRSYSGSIFME